MPKLYSKDEIEAVVLQAIMARPYKEFDGCRVYFVATPGEAAVVKKLAGTREISSLTELEEAVNAPEVKNVFIDTHASVTSKGLKNVLSRTSLAKEIFCAFEPKD